MRVCRQASPTKRAKIQPSRIGVDDETFTLDWLPRPAGWPLTGQLSAPRNAVGVNEYLYLLSRRHPDAVKYASLPPSRP